MKWKALTGLFLLAITVTVISFNDITTFADDTINQPLFTITIPKQLTIDADKCVEYQVRVHRNRTNAGTVTVIPDTEVVLSDSKGKADVTGQVAQDQTQFEFAADGADEQVTNGTVTANDLTAGDWIGSFNFTIDMQETKIGDDITLTSDNLEVYNISTSGDVVIPEYVTDTDGVKHKVTSIDEYTFGDCPELTSITIPNSVTSIGSDAFYGCKQLTSIDIPNSVTILGSFSIANCTGLTSISIPDDIISIGERAFGSCTNLSSVTYKGNTYTNKTDIEKALEENNVTLENVIFDKTALSE